MTRCVASLLLVAALVGWPSPALAQVHPCDTATVPATQIRANTSYKLTLCQPGADGIEDVVIYVTGQPSTSRPVAPMTAPSTTG
jgi:hypothetical protein